MMDTRIPGFTQAEQKLVTTLLFKRYGKFVHLQLSPDPRQLANVSSAATTADLNGDEDCQGPPIIQPPPRRTAAHRLACGMPVR